MNSSTPQTRPEKDRSRLGKVSRKRPWIAENFLEDRRFEENSDAISKTRRFDMLSELGEFYGRTLLHVGCGPGDFLSYLLEKDILPDYTGLDPRPDMVRFCRNRYYDRLGSGCRFEIADTLRYDPPKPFEYIIVSDPVGIFNERVAECLPQALERLFSWCTIALAATFPSTVDPVHALSLALGITPSVRLHHGFLPNEFALYAYRTPAFAELDDLAAKLR